MAERFGTRLRDRLIETGPLCVGVDPSRELLASWDRPDAIEGLEFFALAVLEAVSDVVGAIKPQVAFFERFGAAGYRVLERLISEAHDADVLVVADAKRGDVALTNEGYAQAWLTDESALARRRGDGSAPTSASTRCRRFFEAAASSGRGVFVLAATSNDDGRDFADGAHGQR